MQRLDLGLFWRDLLAIVRRHFAVFATLGAAFIFLPSVVIGFAFPDAATPHMPDPSHPQQLSLLFWVMAAGLGLVTLLGYFSIGAITADPNEGGGRSIGATIAGVVPKIGKMLVVILWLCLAELAVIIVVAIVAVIIGIVAGVSGAKLSPGTSAPMLIGFGVFVLALPPIFWVMTRLAPLLGVLLREPISAYASIKRAWQLSRGSAWRIFILLLATMIVSLAVQLVLLAIARAIGTAPAFPFIVIRSAFNTWLAVYLAAGYGVLYRQLAERD